MLDCLLELLSERIKYKFGIIMQNFEVNRHFLQKSQDFAATSRDQSRDYF